MVTFISFNKQTNNEDHTKEWTSSQKALASQMITSMMHTMTHNVSINEMDTIISTS